MKKVIKSLLLAASVATVCGGFGLAACSRQPEAFEAPTVSISESVLSWNAIDGAVEYTVKINEDETTTVTAVASPSFDVLTVTAKLVEGKNELSVKVNSTDDYLESPYSEVVEYTYTPVDPGPGGDEPAPEKFIMSTVTLDGTTLKWTAVDGATNGYTVKINDDETTSVAGGGTSLDLESDEVAALLKNGKNKLSVKVNAAGNKLASDYSNEVEYDTDRVNADAFIKLVEAIDITAASAETDLSAAKTAYDKLSAAAKELAKDGYGSLKTKDANYFIALVGKIDEDVTTSSGDKIATATAYYELVLDKEAENVVTAKATLDGKEEAYLALFTEYTNAYKATFNVTLPSEPTGSDIDAVAAAIAAAEAYYEENSTDAAVKSALDIVKAKEFNAYKSAYDAAVQKEYNGFVTLLTAVEGIIDAESSLTALNAKLGELTTYCEDISQVNATVITADTALYGRLGAVHDVPEVWEKAIADKKAELSLLIKKITFENGNTNADHALILSSCEAAQGTLAGYVNEGVATELETLKNYADAAKTAIENQVENTIADELRTKLTAVNEAFEAVAAERNATTVAALKEAYADFEASYRKLAKLGVYAKNYFDTEVKISSGADDLLTDAIDEMKETVLATPVETVMQESVSCEGTGGAYITVSRSYVNCRGEAVLLATAPVLTVDATESGDNGAHIRSGYELKANADKVYVAQIVIDEVSKIATARYTVTGGIDTEEAISLNYELNMGNPWFSNDPPPADDTVGIANGYKYCFDGQGNIAFTRGGSYANYYLAVYEADAVVKDTGNCVTFTDAPLATIDVTSGNASITLDELRNLIALKAPYVVGNTYGVRLAIYGVGTNEEKTVHSKFDTSVISQLITLKFTESDLTYGQAVEEEKIVPIGYLSNGWHLHGGDNDENNIDYPWEVANNKDEKVSEVNILIYDATYLLGDPATYDFSGVTPLATLTVTGGWMNWDALGTAIRNGWAQLPNGDKLLSHKLVFAMQAISNDAEYGNSKFVYATDSEGNRAIEEFDMRMQIGINGAIDGGYAGGNLYVDVAGNLPNFVAKFEEQAKLIDGNIAITRDEAGANEYLEVIVRVYDHDDDSENKAPLFEYKSAFVNNFSVDLLKNAWAAEYFKTHSGEETKTYNVDFAFVISVKDDSILKEYFIDSDEQMGQNSAQNVEITLTNPDAE